MNALRVQGAIVPRVSVLPEDVVALSKHQTFGYSMKKSINTILTDLLRALLWVSVENLAI